MNDRVRVIIVCVILAVCITVAYRYIRPEWVSFRKAEKLFERKQYVYAVEQYQDVLNKGLDEPRVISRLIEAQLALGKYDEAGQTAKLFELSRNATSENTYQLSELFISVNRFDDAIGLLYSILVRDHDNQKVLFRLAQILSWKERFDEAEKLYNKALTCSSSKSNVPDWQIRWELARTLSYSKKLDESIAQYKKLLESKADMMQVRAEMGKVMLWNRDNEEALKVLNTVPLESVSPETKIIMAEIYAGGNQYDSAEKIYKEYLRANPSDDGVRFKYAEVLSWAKRYDDSIREYEEILGNRPGDIQLRRKYALVLSWASKYDRAAEELKKTLQIENME